MFSKIRKYSPNGKMGGISYTPKMNYSQLKNSNLSIKSSYVSRLVDNKASSKYVNIITAD